MIIILSLISSTDNENRNLKHKGTNNVNLSQISIEEYSTSLNIAKDKTIVAYELYKKYNNINAVKDVSFAVNKSDCFGILGTSGVGKSSLLDILTGNKLKNNGIIYVEDKDLDKNKKEVSFREIFCVNFVRIFKYKAYLVFLENRICPSK